MATTAYKDALSKEIEQLKEENAELIKHIRPQTLEAMGTKSPDEILKRAKVTFFTKRILISAAAIAVAVGIAFLVGSFMEEISVPFAEDNSISDPDFVPDATDGFNRVGSSTAHPLIAEQGDICYAAQDGYIYKYVGNERTDILSASAEYLNAYKYCLYYHDGSDNTVYKVRTDGKVKTPLMINVTTADIKVYNNTVYVLTDEGDIHSVYINGKTGYPVLEGENILSFTVIDGHIYYIKKENGASALYRTKVSRYDTVKISDTDSSLISASDGYIFYIYNATLYGFDMEEEKAHAFFSGEVKEFAVVGGTLFILSDNTLYASDMTGGNIEKIADGISSVNEISTADIISYAKERWGER